MRFKAIIFNITFALNCLLIFLLLFEQKLAVPAWLQVFGRMHPLLLHFPIVLLILAVFWEMLTGFKKTPDPGKTEIGDGLLLSAAFLAAITSLMGLFLSREEGYTPETLLWHKWSGVAIAVLSITWYFLRFYLRRIKITLVMMGLASVVLIIITGHQGANITHGQNFLLEPVMAELQQPAVLWEDAMVYTHVVKPILETKCMSCHNNKKAKGGLMMETEALMLKGGKNGALWDLKEEDLGLMLRRIHLPLQSRKHMPPQGKPQLTDEEIEIIYHWIKSGASFTTRLTELPENDSLRLLAAPLFDKEATELFIFAAAESNTIQSLTNNYRVIQPIAVGSPALSVTFFSASQFHNDQLKELLSIKEQIVSLSLNKMPVDDEGIKTIAQFPNLQQLNLSFTQITGATLPLLSNLKKLKSLSLSGTNVKAYQLQPLMSLPKLHQLYLWNTSLQPQEITAVQQQFKNVKV